mgnify:CR=1 FL=1
MILRRLCRGVTRKILHFVRIVLQIEELRSVDLRIHDQLVTLVAHGALTEAGADAVEAEVRAAVDEAGEVGRASPGPGGSGALAGGDA